MQLTRTERWILSNQYKILEKLYPEEADYYAHAREAIENGYEMDYQWLTQDIYDEKDCLPEEGCREVRGILGMFCEMKETYDSLPDKSGIDVNEITFRGFSGNNEPTCMAYAEYSCKRGRGQYAALKDMKSFDSHIPMLGRYRRMADEWDKRSAADGFTKEHILRTIEAGKLKQ